MQRHITRTTLAQVMPSWLTEPSHYLNQCWLIVSKVHWYSYERNLTQDTLAINHLYCIENYLSKFSLKPPRGQWVNDFIARDTFEEISSTHLNISLSVRSLASFGVFWTRYPKMFNDCTTYERILNITLILSFVRYSHGYFFRHTNAFMCFLIIIWYRYFTLQDALWSCNTLCYILLYIVTAMVQVSASYYLTTSMQQRKYCNIATVEH